jgi:hypothetical protein
MQEVYVWKCPICKYKTFSKDKQKEHLEEMKYDSLHILIHDNRNMYINPQLRESSEADDWFGVIIDYIEKKKIKRHVN